LEASASCMFVYALATAARHGWIRPEFQVVAQRGFDGIVNHFVRDDDLHGICAVAGLGGQPYRDGSFDYYVSEPVGTNDFKGLGPFMLAAAAVSSSAACAP